MKRQALAIGSVVKLKKGESQPMTVQAIHDDQAVCAWFEGPRVQHSTFRCALLKEYVQPLENKWWVIAKQQPDSKKIAALSKPSSISAFPTPPLGDSSIGRSKSQLLQSEKTL